MLDAYTALVTSIGIRYASHSRKPCLFETVDEGCIVFPLKVFSIHDYMMYHFEDVTPLKNLHKAHILQNVGSCLHDGSQLDYEMVQDNHVRKDVA